MLNKLTFILVVLNITLSIATYNWMAVCGWFVALINLPPFKKEIK